MKKNISKREKEKQELSVIMTCLVVICGSCVLVTLLRALHLCLQEENVSRLQRWPDWVTLGVMTVCCVIIYRMLANVRRKQVFTRQNAHLVIVVGALVELNGIIQQVSYLFVPGDSNLYPTYLIYILLGVFFLFIGCLFKLAVNLKEEQDLTI